MDNDSIDEPSENPIEDVTLDSDGPEDEDEWSERVDADQEASYCCWACGEEIVIPIDLSMGTRQDYVEDCPVCCRPNGIHVEIDTESGHVRCWNDPEG